ncbi:MAG: type II secretion system F family protein [Candidatus Nanopelagicales bacterium]
MAATATFDYQVRDRQGKIVKGRIEADNEAAVAMKLRSMGYAPVTISQANAGMKREINIHIGSGVKLKDLAVMSRQLSTMINSGLSLLRALTILADQTSNKVLRERLADVRNDVEGGTALSVALAAHPKIFPPLMINMVRAGEVGGFLDGVLLQLADNYEKEVRLRGKIKSAMAYPTVIFIIAVLAVVAMLLFIVPIFGEMFASLGGELPAPTRLLQTMSDILKTYFPLFLLGLIVLVVLWARFRHHPRVRDVVDPLKLKVPVFGSLNRKIALSRFTACAFAGPATSGSAGCTSSSTATYTPGAWTVGNVSSYTVTFPYQVVDGAGTPSNTATVTVRVNRPAPPQARSDSATVVRNSRDNLIDVLANDTLPTGRGDVVVTVTGSSNDARCSYYVSNNNIVFTSTSRRTGTINVYYTVRDGTGQASSSLVAVRVI